MIAAIVFMLHLFASAAIADGPLPNGGIRLLSLDGSGFLNMSTMSVTGSSVTAYQGGAWSLTNSSVTASVSGPEADGTTSTTNPIQIGGIDVSGKVQATFVDSTGRFRALVDSGTVSAIPGRPSEDNGRVYVSSGASNLTGNNVFYTVTGGKTLYVTSIVLSGINTNTTINGVLEVRDNTTVQVPLLIAHEGSGLLESPHVMSAAIAASFQEPIRFSTNIRVNIISGAVTYSFFFNGYEE